MVALVSLKLCPAQYSVKEELGFFIPVEQKVVFTSGDAKILCLQTTITTDEEKYQARFTEITSTLKLITENALFTHKADKDEVIRINKIWETVMFHVSALQTDTLNLKKYVGDNETASWRCDYEHEMPAASLLGMLGYVRDSVKAAWKAVSKKAKKGASATSGEASEVLTSLDIDSKAILNLLPRLTESVQVIVKIHEALLQLEIADDLLAYLNQQVTQLQKVEKEHFQVLGCVQNSQGFQCEIAIRKEEDDDIAFTLETVPFMYKSTIYRLDLKAAIIDPTLSLISPSCTPINNQYGCTGVKWITDRCINAINRANMAAIGEHCRFKPEPLQEYTHLYDKSGALVIGPVDQGLVMFIKEEKRVLDFPVLVCTVGTVKVVYNEKVTHFDVRCEGDYLSTFRYNDSQLETIFSHNSWWPAIHDFIPESAQDILVALSATVNILSILIGLTVLCACCKRNGTGQRSVSNFIAIFSRKRQDIVPTAPPETGCSIEMQPLSEGEREQNATKAKVAKRYSGRRP